MPIGKVYSAPEIVLNEKLELKDLPPEHRVAFYGQVRSVKIPANTELYKFTSGSMRGAKGISPWWSPIHSYELDPGLEARLNLARHLGVHPSDLVRSLAAVSEEFNQLQFILRARLKRAVYGLWGQCATMPRQGAEIRPGREIPADQKGTGIPAGNGRTINIRTQNLPGKAWQFYIPNLTEQHIEQISKILVTA